MPAGDLESAIWNEFLYGVRRWMADPGGDLRMTLDPIADQGMERHYEEVGGWMREWYVYVPDGVTASTKDVPLVFANHGYSLNGAVYSGQSDWAKVAAEEKFIVIFPSAIYGYMSSPNANAPWPAWNIIQDPDRMDEIEFFKFMLEDIDKEYDIDRGRVYATGHSWGSQMSHMLAANEPEMLAAIAPLSGAIFNNKLYEQLDAAVADKNFPHVPVYMAGGTEGGEWSLIGVPASADNNTGKTLTRWAEINDIEKIDWTALQNGNANTGSTEWKMSDAYTKEGRWYYTTFENTEGVPMICIEMVEYMPHATMTEHSQRVWDNWFSHYSRNADGEIVYTPAN